MNIHGSAATASLETGRLVDRIAVVAGREIGTAIIERFGCDGAAAIVANRSLPLAGASAARIAQTGKALAVHVDIDASGTTDELVAAAVDRFARLDILMQNAAIYPWSLIHDISVDEWNAVPGVNLRSASLTTRAALEPIKRNDDGRRIFISSITGPRVSSPGHAHYSASKVNINDFIKTAAIEFVSFGITVNAVEPGNILTDGMTAERTLELIDNMEVAVPLVGWARRKTWPTQWLSSPPTRQAILRARRLSSTAGRCCPKPRISASDVPGGIRSSDLSGMRGRALWLLN